jgi:maleamate amidohydrolase
VDALQHGFIPLVVPDACLDRDTGPHEASLFDVGAKYGDLMDLDEACALLAGPGPGGG